MRFNRDRLNNIFKDLLAGLVDVGGAALDSLVSDTVLRVEDFLANHADSANFDELVDHGTVQIIQDAGFNALRLEHEASARIKASIIAVLRALVTVAVV